MPIFPSSTPPLVLWFTGLSGSGKSTLAKKAKDLISQNRRRAYLLDGDIIRTGLCRDLNFSPAGRAENIRRLGEVCKILLDAELFVVTSFISPFRKDRELARQMIGPSRFIEIYADCPLEICEARDVKGLYAKARRGEIPDFTGLDSPYEPPLSPEICIQTHGQSVEESVEQLFQELMQIMKTTP